MKISFRLVPLLAVASTLAACGGARPDAAAVTIALPSGEARVHALQVGTVAAKRCHLTLCDDEATPYVDRVLAILASDDFLPALPNWAYVIEHPEGTFVVDTGELTRFNDDSQYYACDPAAGEVDHNLLRIDVDAYMQIDRRLGNLGIAPTSISGVVLTHLHADHVGGVPFFAGVPVYTSRVDVTLGPLAGGRVCRSLAGADLRYAEDLLAPADGVVGEAFGTSHALTRDGSLQLVPTGGHTPGALSLLLRGRDVDLLFVGDAAFDDAMIRSGAVAGIDADLVAKRATYGSIERQARLRPTVVLPAHDAQVPQRLSKLTSLFEPSSADIAVTPLRMP